MGGDPKKGITNPVTAIENYDPTINNININNNNNMNAGVGVIGDHIHQHDQIVNIANAHNQGLAHPLNFQEIFNQSIHD